MILENTVSGRRGIIDDWMAADFEPKSTKPKSVQDFYAAFWIKYCLLFFVRIVFRHQHFFL